MGLSLVLVPLTGWLRCLSFFDFVAECDRSHESGKRCLLRDLNQPIVFSAGPKSSNSHLVQQDCLYFIVKYLLELSFYVYHLSFMDVKSNVQSLAFQLC